MVVSVTKPIYSQSLTGQVHLIPRISCMSVSGIHKAACTESRYLDFVQIREILVRPRSALATLEHRVRPPDLESPRVEEVMNSELLVVIALRAARSVRRHCTNECKCERSNFDRDSLLNFNWAGGLRILQTISNNFVSRNFEPRPIF